LRFWLLEEHPMKTVTAITNAAIFAIEILYFDSTPIFAKQR
jgi:hypothetical protein